MGGLTDGLTTHPGVPSSRHDVKHFLLIRPTSSTSFPQNRARGAITVLCTFLVSYYTYTPLETLPSLDTLALVLHHHFFLGSLDEPHAFSTNTPLHYHALTKGPKRPQQQTQWHPRQHPAPGSPGLWIPSRPSIHQPHPSPHSSDLVRSSRVRPATDTVAAAAPVTQHRPRTARTALLPRPPPMRLLRLTSPALHRPTTRPRSLCPRRRPISSRRPQRTTAPRMGAPTASRRRATSRAASTSTRTACRTSSTR